MLIKKLCGPRREKNSLRGFENNKGADQSSLPQWFRNNTTSPNKAVGGGTAMTLFRPKRF